MNKGLLDPVLEPIKEINYAKIDGTDIPYEPDSKAIKNMTNFLKSIKSESSITIKPSKRKAKKFELRQPIEIKIECVYCGSELKQYGENKSWDPLELNPTIGYACLNKECIGYKKFYISNYDQNKHTSPIVSDKLKSKYGNFTNKEFKDSIIQAAEESQKEMESLMAVCKVLTEQGPRIMSEIDKKYKDRSPIVSSSDRVVRHSDEEDKTMKPLGVQR